jgi:hypothetical protein
MCLGLQKVCLGQCFLVNPERTQNTLKLQRKISSSSSSNSRRLERKKTKKNPVRCSNLHVKFCRGNKFDYQAFWAVATNMNLLACKPA